MATCGTERTSASERPSTCLCSILFFFSLSLVVLAASCSTLDEYDLLVLATVFPASQPLFLHFPFPFLSFLPLVSRSRTTFINTKTTATRQPYDPSSIPFSLSFTYLLNSFFITGTSEVTITRGNFHVFKIALLPVEEGPSRQSKYFFFFPFSFTSVFSGLFSALGDRPVEPLSTLFRPTRRSHPLLPFGLFLDYTFTLAVAALATT